MPRGVAIGGVRVEKNLYIPLTHTGAVEFVTDWTPGYGFTIESVTGYVAIASTSSGSGSRTCRVLKGASTVVATSTITSDGTDTVGEAITFTVTDANATFKDTDKLTVDFATGGTDFTAGYMNLVIVYREYKQSR